MIKAPMKNRPYSFWIGRMSPFDFFDSIHCINMDCATERWRNMRERFARLGIGDRVQRFSAIATPGNHHIGCALSHRALIAQARERGYRRILVFEDDALFLDRTPQVLAQALPELERIHWHIFYLGAMTWGRELPPEPGCEFLSRAQGVTCTHALAYHEDVFPSLLQELPADIAGMADWLIRHQGIDQYLGQLPKAVMLRRPVSTQPFLLPYESPADQFHFTI